MVEEELRARIEALREILETRPDGIRAGSLPHGIDSIGLAELPPDLALMLSITNGPRCGTVVLFADSELPSAQFYCESVDGGSERWICFGTYDVVPLFMDRRSQSIWWDSNEDGVPVPLADNIFTFFKDYLVGERYSELAVSGGDYWQEIIYGLNGSEA
ncbi:hypothetical protein ACFYV7_02975 [Nocardia suismassiliense]|uniref:SMI1/KNR4 family protein n=1 Tax=Nocardia suismassiliense TaxID=2077092 RepID=A0ABW6QKJ7_9NOCA